MPSSTIHGTHTPPPQISWLSSDSSDHSNDTSFEYDEDTKKKLLQTPKVW